MARQRDPGINRVVELTAAGSDMAYECFLIADGSLNDRKANVDAYGSLGVTLKGAGGTPISDSSESDAASNHSGALGVLSHPYRYNPTANSWERWRGNHNATVLASASRSATVNSADQTNLHCRGVLLCFNVTVVPGVDTVQLGIQGKDPLSGEYIEIVQSTALATTGARFIYLAPGAAALGSFNNYFNGQIPHTWRARVTHSGAGAFTYSVGAMLLK